MSLRLEGNTIHLHGECRVEEAEPLLQLLQADSSRAVDLSGANSLHTAVFQVLLALRPEIRGVSGDSFVRDRIVPLLTETQASKAANAFSKGLD